MAGNEWTIHEIGILRAMTSQGNDAKTIARHLNRTEAAVRAKAEELGISLR